MTAVLAGKTVKIVTRYPNLEVGFFGALLEYLPPLRDALDLDQEIQWEFISTAEIDAASQRRKHEPGVLCFDIGGCDLDHHGLNTGNLPFQARCSLDLLREKYDFVARYPFITEAFDRVRLNDLQGEAVSRHPHNIRELMTALTASLPDEPQVVLDWLSVAFCGVFWLCQSNDISNDQLFDPDTLLRGVSKYCPERYSWFSELLQTAENALQVEWDLAVAAVGQAVKQGWSAEVFVPALKRKIKVILVFGDSTKIGPAARKQKFNLIIQANPDGHVQIFSGTINDHQSNRRWKIHLGALAARLRELEAVFNGRKIRVNQDWEATGNIYYDNGVPIPWHLPEFSANTNVTPTALFNGSLSSLDVPASKIGSRKLFLEARQALPRCSAILQEQIIDEEEGHDVVRWLTTIVPPPVKEPAV